MTNSSVSTTTFFLLLLLNSFFTGVTAALKQISLPHLDIYMLCSNDIRDTFEYVLELDGFYSDLLPSALDIGIGGGSEDFVDCAAQPGRTQVHVHAEGFAVFNEDSPFDEDEIKTLVTKELLASYFEGVCDELEEFEALILDAESDPATGIVAEFGKLHCELDEEVTEIVIEAGEGVSVAIFFMIFCCCIICWGAFLRTTGCCRGGVRDCWDSCWSCDCCDC